MRTSYCLILLCVLIGCKREERPLQADVSATNVARAVELSEVVPGLPPATQPAINSTPGPVPNDYEKTAFLMAEGERLYRNFNCKGCHASGGGGDIGPALIDDQWIYGSDPQQVYASIIQGRPNGMPAYGRRITEHQAWELTAYVRSLSGQVSQSAAPGRDDHTKTSPPPNTIDPVTPKNSGASKSTEKP